MLSSRIPRAGTTFGSWAEGGAEEGKATSPPRATFHQSCTPLYGVGSFQKLPHPKSSLQKQARNAISEIHSPELRFFNVTKPWDSGVRNLHNAAAVGRSSSLTCTSHHITTTGFCDSRVLWFRASRHVSAPPRSRKCGA